MTGRHRGRASRVSLAARASLGRVSWGLADQAVSSLTNFAVGVVVARSLGVADFGLFSIVWVTFAVALNLSRGVATDPLVVRFSGVDRPSWRAAAATSTGTALLIGLALGTGTTLVGLAVGGTLGAGLLALGIGLPGLLLQDSWRFAFIAHGDGRRAFVNDVVWGAALVPALLIAAAHGSVFAFVLAWGLAGSAAACFGVWQARLLPRPAQAMAWFTAHRDLCTRYSLENVSNSGAGQIRMYGLGAIAGLADVGAVRGSELLMGPFFMILLGLSLVSVAEASRQLRDSHQRMLRFCITLGGVQAAAALLWGLAIWCLPNAAGRFLLGEVWGPASALIVPVALSATAAGLCTGAATGLRALGASRRSLRVQLLQSSGYVVSTLVGAAIAGALGSSWGVVVAMWIAAVLWWVELRRAVREDTADPGRPHLSAPADLEEVDLP